MSQEDVLNYLKKKKRWVTSLELRKELKISQGNVSRACRKLLKNNDIQFKEVIFEQKILLKNKPYIKQTTCSAWAYKRVKKMKGGIHGN